MIIAIHAKANAGKSTVARILREELGAVEVSIADPIKRIAQDLFDFTDEQLWGPSECRNVEDTRYPLSDAERYAWCKETHVHGPECGDPIYLTSRKVCQDLGYAMRLCWEDVWVWRAARLASEHAVAVIPDVRYPSEMNVVRRYGARMIRVKRPGAGLSGAAGAHPSEAEMDAVPDSAFDAVIENDGTLEDLRARVLAAVSPWLPARAA